MANILEHDLMVTKLSMLVLAFANAGLFDSVFFTQRAFEQALID